LSHAATAMVTRSGSKMLHRDARDARRGRWEDWGSDMSTRNIKNWGASATYPSVPAARAGDGAPRPRNAA
jgi:hypothetical protein